MLAVQPAKTSIPEMESQNKLQGIIVKQAAQDFGSENDIWKHLCVQMIVWLRHILFTQL